MRTHSIMRALPSMKRYMYTVQYKPDALLFMLRDWSIQKGGKSNNKKESAFWIVNIFSASSRLYDEAVLYGVSLRLFIDFLFIFGSKGEKEYSDNRDWPKG
jgi:hypothetical protein